LPAGRPSPRWSARFSCWSGSERSGRDADVHVELGPTPRWLSEAHLANEAWNAGVPTWNRHPSRRARARRSKPGAAVALPPIARHALLFGEIRPHDDPRSTLFNTDGQIFSDAGIPVVLLMEDYDIERSGYHDSHDTMAAIDLDFGAAMAAIAIEAVARAADRAFPEN
jgi:hypothetical protein